MGSAARRMTMPGVVDWLKRHSSCRGCRRGRDMSDNAWKGCEHARQSESGRHVRSTRCSARCVRSGPATRRALAGVRNAEEWVELTYGRAHGRHRVGQHPPRRAGAPQGRRALPAAAELDRSGDLHLRRRQAGRRRVPDHHDLPAARAGVHPRAHRVQGGRGAVGVPGLRLRRDGAGDGRRLARTCGTSSASAPPTSTASCTSEDLLRPRRGGRSRPRQAAADDLAVLAFTSGTTGEPKGVMHSHASMHAMIDDFVGHAAFGHGLTSLVMSPIGHMTGFTGVS